MSSLNSVIKTLIKINLAAGLLSLLSLMIIRQQQAQQIYRSQSSPSGVQVYHASLREKAGEPGGDNSNSVNTLELAEKVEKLEGELAQTREKVTNLSGNKGAVAEGKTGRTTAALDLSSRVATQLSISPEYRIGRGEGRGKRVETAAVATRPPQVNPRAAAVNESPETPKYRGQRGQLNPIASSRVLKSQEIAQASHLEQQKLGLSKPQTLQARTNPYVNRDNEIQNQEVTPLPPQPLVSEGNRVIISLTEGNSAVTASVPRRMDDSLVREKVMAEEATLLYGDADITLSSSNINNPRLLSRTEKNASIRLANDIAYGLIIAGEKGHINYGTNAYRRVQTAIRVLRRGENLYDAARIAEVPSELLRQLIRWGENRPGSLAAMIESNPDDRELR